MKQPISLNATESRDPDSHDDGCACGEPDEALPELDVQTIPHAVRHAAIFGALESLAPRSGMIISATHNPFPLLAQLGRKHPDVFETSYLDEGPERWRIKIVRRPDAE
ncbi:DUF2249 domain-containing protein [Paramicrobacterium fandaimingii]|uniref:DUF2249 domain-containing protein n=1 Tax=Paramicrobacterium fandaimingii TaxID=2708079 RepID=UPI00141F02B2|nr:DUF2249 domain-containing protein [Microbacterium fandaimingii]